MCYHVLVANVWFLLYITVEDSGSALVDNLHLSVASGNIFGSK